MIRNDLHIHSAKSLCGLHSLMEIVEIAANKRMRSVNICDHGNAAGKKIDFSVITNKNRCPSRIISSKGTAISVLAGIEANILDIDGNSDFPTERITAFDLVSAGFHSSASALATSQSVEKNMRALKNYLKRYPLDILTHPCITTFPLDNSQLIKLALKYGFALEVNNTNLRLGKTDVERLQDMIQRAQDGGAILCENSDGHTFMEIGENEQIVALLKEMRLNGNDCFINRDDKQLDDFLKRRKKIRSTF